MSEHKSCFEPILRLWQNKIMPIVRKHIAEWGRFLLIGGWSTLVDCAVLAMLTVWANWDPTPAYIAGFTTSIVSRYFIDRYYTFKHTKMFAAVVWKEFFQYILSCCLAMAIGTVIFYAGIYLELSVALSKIISIPPVTISGYLLFRFLVFRAKISP